ncbi:hypothetical protein RB595_001567 [Gaeumannomyces hyphopodioides]
MPQEEANSTWHPAFMPDAAPIHVSEKTLSTTADADGASQPQQDDSVTADALEAPPVEATQTNSVSAETPSESPEAAAATEFTNEDVAPLEMDAGFSPRAAANTSMHKTRDSFARTVSQGINWDAEGDDTEWNLPRTDTDPFVKFMAPSERTNSFPVVPPVPQSSQQSLGRHLAITQAEELMAEVDREVSPVRSAAPYVVGFAKEADNLRENEIAGAASTQQYVGGEIAAPEVEASDERYDEGVPLISHQEQPQSARSEQAPGTGFGSPFADTGAGEDDFFSRLGGSEGAKPDVSFTTPGLERKSTMQVMGSLSATTPTRSDTGLEDMLETAEEDDFWSKPADTSETPAGPAAQESAATENATASQADTEPTKPEQKDETVGGDLADKWAAAFGDEDDGDFLLDDSALPTDQVDPAAFLGDDDDGLLEDTEEMQQPSATVPSAATPAATAPVPAVNGRYTPANITPVGSRQPSSSSQYVPAAAPFLAQSTTAPPAVAAPFGPPVPTPMGYGAPPPRPDTNKAASFVNQSKGGYTSPYDLPMDFKPPKKRASAQPIPRAASQPPPMAGPHQPQRSDSMPPPPVPGVPGQHAPPPPKQVSQRAGSNEGFFADLPVSSRARPASRSSPKSASSPQFSAAGAPPAGHPPGYGLAPTQGPPAPGPQTNGHPPTASALPGSGLVAPERVNPYAALQSDPGHLPAPHVPSASTNRYSPAPGATASAPVPASNRYSPAPAGNRAQSSAYAPAQVVVAPPILPHQPRTSSPLAHFEISSDRGRSASHDAAHPPRRSTSSIYEPQLNRVPSLPSTLEIDETAPQTGMHSSSRPSSQGTTALPGQGPPQASQARGRTPPPLTMSHQQATLSPPKRTPSYAPQPAQQTLSPHGPDFVPPPRSHTQSPGALYGKNGIKPSDPIPRPSSVHDLVSPRSATSGHPSLPVMSHATATAPAARPRGFSQSLNLVPPTDGREHDPLQRWKGAPLMCWGVGGTIVTSFPKDVPRYGINQTLPTILRSPGEVKIRNVKEIYPLDEQLAKFPGPLKGKSKKKETISWLSAGIEALEARQPRVSFQPQASLDDKRAEERILLWKILRVFIEHDGTLEGATAVESAVRDALSPGLDPLTTQPTAYGLDQGTIGLQGASTTQMTSDGVDSGVVEQIRRSLMIGDREKAVWDAADKRLWGHALLIANTVSSDLYKKVSQEFVRKEVNYPGHNNESLAVLYEVLSGNHEECVDELVPVHARAGLQLMGTGSGHGQSTDALAGLDKWRETLGLVLSNRSTNDVQALTSLGNLLAGYGRAEAAHICYIFARTASVFGGIDDPKSHFVLIGADHKRQADHFAKETEALLLSEVYEYGLALAGGSKDVNCPHLAMYKLQHAMTLAESGYGDKALQYCDTLAHAITSQTRRSPYHHAGLEASVENLAQRLKQAPKEQSGSWISKPTVGKVSDSVWNRFNKFVAGDEGEGSENGSAAGGGIFAGVSGGGPTISRPPSPPGATGMEMFGGAAQGGPPAYPPLGAAALMSPPATKAASRYAPGAALAPVSTNPYEPQQGYPARGPPSAGRSSGEYSRGSPEMPRRSSEFQRPSYNPAYQPNSASSPSMGYVDPGIGLSSEAPSAGAPSVGPQYGGYQPYMPDHSSNGSPYGAGHDNQTEKPASAGPEPGAYQGYQPPSYGYEPPSMGSAEPVSATDKPESEVPTSNGGYEPPTFQPYSYEPPTFEPGREASQDDDRASQPREEPGHSPADSFPPPVSTSRAGGKTKEEIDRENAEMFRKAAEEDAKRAEEEKAKKKSGGWFTGGWFGGGKKEAAAEQPKAIRAKLGEQNNFYFDPELKRWVNKAAGADAAATPTATPPPPRSGSPAGAPPGRASAPPRGPLTASASIPNLAAASQSHSSLMPGAPPMARSVSNNSEPPIGPPRPASSMSNASSIDDLLSAAGPRKPGAKKARKSGRYVDVMAK